MELIFTPDDSGTARGSGYATVPYSSDSEDETVVETTQENIATIFEEAKASGESLDGVDVSIGAAVEDPLTYLDYLVLESDEIVFDTGYARENK